MLNIKIKNSKLEGDRWLDNRSDPYIYSVKSWQQWCDKNNAELFVLEDLLLPNEDMAIPWQKFYIFDILLHNLLHLYECFVDFVF